MTLRELNPDQLRALQQRCEAEFSNWQNGNGQRYKTEQDIWNYAWSRGLSSGLGFEAKEKKE